MGNSEKLILEATQIALAMLAGEATPEESARLDELIVAHSEVASAVLEIVGQETWLVWSSKEPVDAASGSEPLSLYAEIIEPSRDIEVLADARRVAAPAYNHPAWFLAAASLLLIVGGLAGAYVAEGLSQQAMRQQPAAPFQSLTSFSGRILNASACR